KGSRGRVCWCDGCSKGEHGDASCFGSVQPLRRLVLGGGGPHQEGQPRPGGIHHEAEGRL
ncbi:hypothetical protein ACFOYZ_29395, partial [Neobacillus cucumis]|uniref:hypothetical protein n=1 Tax=Neobacillus cucumis TaxID=1740721 RepID=UPI0036156A58